MLDGLKVCQKGIPENIVQSTLNGLELRSRLTNGREFQRWGRQFKYEPHLPITPATMALWLKESLKGAGIEGGYSVHSTFSTAASIAFEKVSPLQTS